MYVVVFKHKGVSWHARKVFRFAAAAERYAVRAKRHLAHWELPTDLCRILSK
jgi:hypothetical protein